MPSNTAQLAINVETDVSDVETKFASAGGAVSKFGDDIDSASRKADDSAGRLTNVADKADQVGSSSAEASGGIGDLGGALSLLPGPLGKVGMGMEVAGTAIMGITGAADLAKLSLESGRLATIRATVAAKVHTAATWAQAGAQKALNLALKLSPLGLIITALALVATGLVVAYKKSETFRRIVDGAMGGVKSAIDAVVGAVNKIIDAVVSAVSWVKELVEWLAKVDLKDPKSYYNLGGRVMAGSGGTVNNFTIQGALDPGATARQIQKILDRQGRSTGSVVFS